MLEETDLVGCGDRLLETPFRGLEIRRSRTRPKDDGHRDTKHGDLSAVDEVAHRPSLHELHDDEGVLASPAS